MRGVLAASAAVMALVSLSAMPAAAQTPSLPAGAVSSPIITATFSDLTQGTLANTQGDAPILRYPSLYGDYSLVSHWEHLPLGNGQFTDEIRQVLVSGSLDAPYTSVAWNKPTCVRDNNGYCIPASGALPPYPAFTSFSGLTTVRSLFFVSFYWPFPGQNAKVLAFIHEEQVAHAQAGDPSYTRLGLAWSTDAGNTWTYLGRIIAPDCDFVGDGYVNIVGAPYIIKDGYLYVYYTDTIDSASSCSVGGIGVSRALVSEVLAAAEAGGVGDHLWHKLYHSAWNEPSIDADPGSHAGGHADFPFNPGIYGATHTQAVYSNYTQKFYLPLYYGAWGDGQDAWVNLYESTDGVNWSLATTLADEPSSTQRTGGGYTYCSPADPSGADHYQVGQKFYVYCFKYSEFTTNFGLPYAQYRWTVNLGPSVDTYRQSADFGSTQGPRWRYLYGSGLNDMVWNSGGFWQTPNSDPNESFDRIYPDTMHPGLTESPVLMWTAPKPGTITVRGVVRDANPASPCNNSDGIGYRLVFSAQPDSDIVSGTIADRDTIGVSTNATLQVYTGDALFFMIGGLTNNNCDSTYWDPSIEYH